MKNLQTNLAVIDNLSSCIKTDFRRVLCPDGFKCQYKFGQMANNS